MAKLFGFSIQPNEEPAKSVVSPVPPSQEDGNDNYLTSGFFGSYVDLEGVFKTEFDLIKRYREMSLHPECDSAIEDIIQEAIVTDTNDSPVEIELSNLNASDGIKKTIRQEFKNIKDLLDFDKKSHEIYRNWYVDGRVYYHKVIDLENPKQGILELRNIDAVKIRKVRQKIVNPEVAANPQAVKGTALQYDWGDYVEYYIYQPKGFSGSMTMPHNSASDFSTNNGIKIASDSIATVNSGVMDLNKKYSLSFLHKAIKSLNQLRMIEDSLVIYRLSRAPERRIFYIDVGNLPKVKAEQYLRDVMARYRNKLVYDASTGEIRDDKKHMSMLEDFWLPRREGGRGTEITTLPGGQNLGELKDVEYFRKKLYNSLNLPPSRLTDDNKAFNLGKSTEILRDELKFSKFIGRLRKRFSRLFHDILKTQLILKGVIAPEDWEDMEEHIQYDFLFDNHFNELKKQEMMMQRITLVTQMDPFVGKYFSTEYIRRQVLMQTEKEYKEIDKQMRVDIDSGMVIDPVDVTSMDMMDRQNDAFKPELDAQSAEDDATRELDKAKEMEKLKPAPAPTKPKADK